ncbi:adenosine receptor A3-like [Stylophora pistillata]|uniref:adenosine receptor A3-like n=1 Tax=Stylophora pistillata TaxID=50429 RepID=UPI000C057178|nr:adenosine receptor A3-like [Stylophora pistillata]
MGMFEEECKRRLNEVAKTVSLNNQFMLSLCVFYFAFSPVAIVGNVLAIRAILKAVSLPPTFKKLLLSLAVSDLAVGLFLQPIYGAIIALHLSKRSSQFLCPTVLTIQLFFTFLVAGASFMTVTAIALDRLLAVYLHLRYQELVTPKRVGIVLILLWISAAFGASVFILLSDLSDLIAVITEVVGFAITTMAYFYLYRVVRYHQNQIQSQCQFQDQNDVQISREKKSAVNTLYVYAVFLVCYLPLLFSSTLLMVNHSNTSFQVAYNISGLMVFLNSSLNPFVYCWRYREISQFVKSSFSSFKGNKDLSFGRNPISAEDVEEVINILSSCSLENTPVKDKENNSNDSILDFYTSCFLLQDDLITCALMLKTDQELALFYRVTLTTEHIDSLLALMRQ